MLFEAACFRESAPEQSSEYKWSCQPTSSAETGQFTHNSNGDEHMKEARGPAATNYIALPQINPMIRENRQLVEDGPVEVQECRKITDHFRGIYGICPNLIKGNRRMSTCNRLDLQTLGSQPIYAQKSPQSLDQFLQRRDW